MTTPTAPAAPYTKSEAKAHDALLAEATTAHRREETRRDDALYRVHTLAGDRRATRSGWGISDAEARQQATAIAAEGGPQASSARRALDTLAAAEAAIADHRAEIARLEQIWSTHGRWPRFFMVSGGHIHRWTACHTLRPTTRIGWLPDLSGESEAEAVAAFGAVLCTVCFPSAPVEWTSQAPRAADPSVCAGSGRYVPNAQRRYRSAWGDCPTCGQQISVTTRGLARKHKAAEGPADPIERACEACTAEAGEECRPDCIGAAAHADEREQDQ